MFIAMSACCCIPEFSNSCGFCKRIYRSEERGVNVLGKKDEGITQNDNGCVYCVCVLYSYIHIVRWQGKLSEV